LAKYAEGEEDTEKPAEAPPAEPPAGDVGGDDAMAAMSVPAPADAMGGTPPVSEEDAMALMGQSYLENGVDPATPDGDPGMESEVDISPEEMALLEQIMAEAGVSPEEVAAVIEELAAEQQAGISPEAGMIADEEAAKTGHYKFASFVNRPATKTAEQQRRAAVIRGAVRDFLYGPGTSNFN
jgi:hypothetical protein